ncbi:MAG: glycosyltransferase [Muribaculaceae bacterium]|nr:glycosyltransferase [Muribaculaceae bacterium]
MSNKNPLISIITPCFNAEAYLSQTIESLINQTYTNWELIIINDCSTDNSLNIIKDFQEKDRRIKLYNTCRSSGSPSEPRNIGINNADGEYIAFLDADDIWFSEKLEIQINFMKKNNYDISYSYYEKINWSGVKNNRVIKTRKITTFRNILKSNSIPCLTSMVSKKAIGETRFKQIPQEDFCFWIDILKKGFKAYNMCVVTALYRESPSSRSSNKLAMFKGYWNVIRREQHINFVRCCYFMITYSILGFIKFIK